MFGGRRHGWGGHHGWGGPFAHGLCSTMLYDLVLEALGDKPKTGYDAIKAVEARFKGWFTPSPEKVYPIGKHAPSSSGTGETTCHDSPFHGIHHGFQGIHESEKFNKLKSIITKAMGEIAALGVWGPGKSGPQEGDNVAS